MPAFKRYFMYRFLWILLWHTGSAYGQEYITGEQDGTIGPGKFTITGTIYVLPDKTLHITAGTTLFFEQFTGIVVQGTLVCDGNQHKPIKFTTEREKMDSAEPFGWNGIKITPEARSATIMHTHICYSTFGINIQSDFVPVILDHIMFSDNGYVSLTRSKKTIWVKDHEQVNIRWPESAAQLSVDRAAKESSKENGSVTVRSRRPVIKRFLRIGTGLLTATGAAMWIGGHIAAQRRHEDYVQENDPSRIGPLKEKLHHAIVVRNMGLGMTGMGCAYFGFTFIIRSKK